MSYDLFAIAVCFLAGALLGALYLGGLWLTVRHLQRARQPVALLVASAGVRIALLCAALAALTSGRSEMLLACVAGFVLVRTLVSARLLVRPAHRPSGAAGLETSHAD